jgi:hypothetical protein
VWFLYEVIGAERYPKKGMRIPEWCMSRSVVENVFQENYKRINVTWRFAVRNGPSICSKVLLTCLKTALIVGGSLPGDI